MSEKKKIGYVLTFVLTVIYLVWRLLFTLPIHGSWFALIYGILLLGSEAISNLTGIALIYGKSKAVRVPKPEADPANFPDIDVLIATHNEEPELLLKTVNACLHMEYPDPSKVHFYICDDAGRKEIQELAEHFGVHYLGMTHNTQAKSGNLNNAMAKTSSPLIATFDADMIPYSQFLMEAVPYFVNQPGDKSVGLVQTPQSFYNADLFQMNLFAEGQIANEQDFFSREINTLNNAFGCAVYTGSNTVLSRQAIEDAGGFPTDTITEDFELGTLLNIHGYQNLSTEEPMASGLTPTDIPSVLKQRIRWGRGVVRSLHNIRYLFNPNLTFDQKLSFSAIYLYWWSFWRRLIYIGAPILFTVFGIRVVDNDFWTLLIFWLPAYAMMQWMLQSVSSDIRTQRWGEIQETIFAPYLAFPVLMEVLGFKEKKFKVTDKSAQSSKKDWVYMIPHLILLVLAVYGLVKFNYGKFGSEILYGSVITFWLLSHTINLFFAVMFYLGRPLFRKSERFKIQTPVVVSTPAQTIQTKTESLSETGLSFFSDYPFYFKEGETLSFLVQKGTEKANLTGRVVRVSSFPGRWVYGVALDTPSEKDYLSYLQIIYDGFNQNLPQFRDPFSTLFDQLVENIRRRTASTQTQGKTAQKTPELLIQEEGTAGEDAYTAERFDFHTMTLKKDPEVPLENKIAFHIHDVRFELESRQEEEEYVVYNVSNLPELLENKQFDSLLQRWSQEEGE